MPRPTNKQVVEAFVNHRRISTNPMTNSLRVESSGVMGSVVSQRLMSYNTCIVEWSEATGFIYNPSRYSTTTSKHQSLFMCYMYRHYNFGDGFSVPTHINGQAVHIIMDYVPVGTQSLGDLQGCTLSRRFQDRYGSRMARVTQRVTPIEQQIIFD